MKTLLQLTCATAWFFAPLLASAQVPQPVREVEFHGPSGKQKANLDIAQSATDGEFQGGSLHVGKEKVALGRAFFGFTAELSVHRIFSDRPTEVLAATAMADGDFQTCFLYAYVDGRLKKLGAVHGQGDITFPGNGSLVARGWMGFWMKTEKYVFGKNLELSKVAQEFYSVDVEGTVLKSFPVYQTRKGDAVLANTREGSKFKILLWDPASRKPDPENDNMDNDWYLIRTETGFTGWVRGASLQYEQAELPWAG